MTTMAQSYQPHRIGALRVIFGILLFIVLLVIAWAVRAHTNHASAPSGSTNQANPNVPPTGQSNQGNNSSQDAVPSANGTNGVQGSGR